MLRKLTILVLQGFLWHSTYAQSFTVDDLLTLSSVSPKRFDNFMHEKGFISGGRTLQDGAMALTFFLAQTGRGRKFLGVLQAKIKDFLVSALFLATFFLLFFTRGVGRRQGPQKPEVKSSLERSLASLARDFS